jgi:1-phosphofructokinase family hexose kinase
VNRGQESQLDPAAKGVNVSRMAHRLGWPTVALGFLGGEIGRLVRRALDADGVQHHLVPIPGQTRLSVTVVDTLSSVATSVRVPGPMIDPQQAAELDRLVQFWLRGARVLVLAGQLPPGVASDAYARYIEAARARNVLTILDADGDALRRGIRALPSLIKPNLTETEELLGRPLPTIESTVQAARELAGRGIDMVVSSKRARGAIAVQGSNAW